MAKSFRPLTSHILGSPFLHGLLALWLLLALVQTSLCDQIVESNGMDATSSKSGVNKRAIDKMRYYGALGKRGGSVESQEESDSLQSDDNDEEASSSHEYEKRLDKMRFYSGLGKRDFDGGNRHRPLVAAPESKRLDKMRFYSGLGKRYYDFLGKNKKSSQKKSKIDRLRYMGSLGK